MASSKRLLVGGVEMKKAILIIALLSIFAGCDSDEPDEAAQLEKERKERLEEELQIKQRVQELCSRYNAVVDWQKGHLEYTVEVEDALIRTDGQAVLLFGAVDDIVGESGKYRVYFRSPALFDRLAGRENYAVAARVSSVKKVRFEPKAYSTGDEYEGEVTVHLESSNLFLANGICLELLDVGDYMKYLPLDWLRIDFVLDCTEEQVSKIMLHRVDTNRDS